MYDASSGNIGKLLAPTLVAHFQHRTKLSYIVEVLLFFEYYSDMLTTDLGVAVEKALEEIIRDIH